MGKLAEFLREIKKEKKPSPFKEKEKVSKRRLFFLILFAILFSGSFLGGFYLVKMFSLLKAKDKKPFQHPPEYVYEVKRSPQGEIPPTQNNATQSKGSPEVTDKQVKKSALQKHSTPGNKTLSKNKDKIKREKETLSMLKKKREPEKLEEKIETLTPQGAPILKEKGLLENLLFNAEEERKKGNYMSAIKFYEEYLKHRTDPDALNNLGGLYYLTGNFDGAKIAFEKALKLKYDPSYELNYLMVLLKKGEREKACRELRLKTFPQGLQDKVKTLEEMCK